MSPDWARSLLVIPITNRSTAGGEADWRLVAE
jgi:hypothetical protein